MNVQVTFRGMSSTQAIVEFVEEQIEHATRHLQATAAARVVLATTEGEFTADIELTGVKSHPRSHDRASDLYDAVRGACTKLQRQLDDDHSRKSGRRPDA